MNEVVHYVLQVNVILAICYGVYRLCSQGSTLFHIHRSMLWGVYLMAMCLPFVHWDLGLSDHTVQEMTAHYMTHLHPNDWPMGGTQQIPVWGLWILGVYGLGVLVLYIRFLIQLGTLLYMGATASKVQVNGQWVCVLPNNASPFSFFHWVFLDPARHTKEELTSILLHEQAHVSQRHSLDIIWAELVTMLFWFNPFAWLIKREIRTNLEFLADNAVCKQTPNIKVYQYHLLGLACGGAQKGLVNRMNRTPLKKRVLMMNKKKSMGRRGLRYLLFVPVVVVLGLLSHLDVLGRTLSSAPKDGEMKSSGVPTNCMVIVDGQEYTKDINDIPPSDIEAISVIKGESATRTYGSKGKNGVIVITMKH